MKLLATVLTLSCALAAGAEPTLPQQLDNDGFNQVLVSTGNLFIAGQPSEAALERMRDAGVTTVINLRTNAETDNRDVVPFDEAALVAKLGMTYVHIPAGGPDTPYVPEMVETFATALDAAEGKVLLHCTVGWRASHLWTAYLVRHQGMSLEDAVRLGQAVNLGTLPLEEFLGEKLTYVVETP